MSEKNPKNWKVKRLGDFLVPLMKSKLPSGLSDKNGYYNFYVCSQNVLKSFHNEMSSPAVLLSTGGEAVVHYANGEYSYSTDVWATNFTGEIYNEYAFRIFEKDLEKINYSGFQGSGIKHLDKKFIEKLTYAIPSLSEQNKITSILTSVDEVIVTTQKQIDKFQDLKKATMNELLTRGIDHKEFKDSVLGRIPKSWEVKTLIDVATNGISNGVFNDPKMQGSGYRLINVYDMYQGFGIDDKQLTKLDISEKEFQKNKVKYGDIFLTRSSLKLEGIAHCNICLSNEDDITYDGHLMKISPNTLMVEPIFLVLQCLSDYGRIFFMKMAKQSTMTTIGQQDIAPLSIALPALEEQKKIVIVHNSFETKIDALKLKLNQIQSLKKSLMQVLLTGKVRVKVN